MLVRSAVHFETEQDPMNMRGEFNKPHRMSDLGFPPRRFNENFPSDIVSFLLSRIENIDFRMLFMLLTTATFISLLIAIEGEQLSRGLSLSPPSPRGLL